MWYFVLLCYFWIFLEYLDSDQTAQDFNRLTSPVANSGSWPYNCDQLIPCNDVPHQTCGCKNFLEEANSDNFAVVYNMNVTGSCCNIQTLIALKKISSPITLTTIHLKNPFLRWLNIKWFYIMLNTCFRWYCSIICGVLVSPLRARP